MHHCGEGWDTLQGIIAPTKSLPAGLFLASLEELPDGIQLMTPGTRKPFPEE